MQIAGFTRRQTRTTHNKNQLAGHVCQLTDYVILETFIVYFYVNRKKISKFDWHHKTNERAGETMSSAEMIFTRNSSHNFVSTSFNPFSYAPTNGDENYFHNKTPTSGGNILIFMLPKHEKELRLLWYTRAKTKKKKKSSNKRKKKVFFWYSEEEKIPIGIYLLKKHSLDGLPSKKNNYLIVCFFPSYFFAFIHKRVESGKFSGCAQENKVLHFIKYSLSCACFFICLKDFSTMHTTAAVGFWGNITRT